MLQYRAADIGRYLPAMNLIGLFQSPPAPTPYAFRADWRVVGGFWVGVMAMVAGVAGTCVTITEHSGGFPTALFFLQSAMCLVAASLSLVLLDGLGERRPGNG